jgi:hypothetical protein
MSSAQAPGTPNKRRRNASNIGGYFKIEEGRQKCTVQNCRKDYGLGTSNTSLMYHLKTQHDIILIDTDAGLDTDSDKEKDSPSQSFSAASSKLSAKRQDEITEMLIKLIVDGVQPLNITVSESFRNLAYALEPRYVFPDTKTVKQMVAEKYNKLQSEADTDGCSYTDP